jgi:hypothetical protein
MVWRRSEGLEEVEGSEAVQYEALETAGGSGGGLKGVEEVRGSGGGRRLGDSKHKALESAGSFGRGRRLRRQYEAMEAVEGSCHGYERRRQGCNQHDIDLRLSWGETIIYKGPWYKYTLKCWGEMFDEQVAFCLFTKVHRPQGLKATRAVTGPWRRSKGLEVVVEVAGSSGGDRRLLWR